MPRTFLFLMVWQYSAPTRERVCVRAACVRACVCQCARFVCVEGGHRVIGRCYACKYFASTLNTMFDNLHELL